MEEKWNFQLLFVAAAVRSTAEENPCQFESVHRAKRHGHDRIYKSTAHARPRDTGLLLVCVCVCVCTTVVCGGVQYDSAVTRPTAVVIPARKGFPAVVRCIFNEKRARRFRPKRRGRNPITRARDRLTSPGPGGRERSDSRHQPIHVTTVAGVKNNSCRRRL